MSQRGENYLRQLTIDLGLQWQDWEMPQKPADSPQGITVWPENPTWHRYLWLTRYMQDQLYHVMSTPLDCQTTKTAIKTIIGNLQNPPEFDTWNDIGSDSHCYFSMGQDRITKLKWLVNRQHLPGLAFDDISQMLSYDVVNRCAYLHSLKTIVRDQLLAANIPLEIISWIILPCFDYVLVDQIFVC
jgi:hypothetical protein